MNIRPLITIGGQVVGPASQRQELHAAQLWPAQTARWQERLHSLLAGSRALCRELKRVTPGYPLDGETRSALGIVLLLTALIALSVMLGIRLRKST
jgi:hypothetical protein